MPVSKSAYSELCMYNCLQDTSQHFPSLKLGPKSPVLDQQTPLGFFWASAATSIPDISRSVIAIDEREGNAETVTKGLQHAATMPTS